MQSQYDLRESGHHEPKLNYMWHCHKVESLTCDHFREHLFCVCAVATLTFGETRSLCGKNNATICHTSAHLILIVTDLFLSVCRKSPAANQPSVTKVCLSGESYNKPSSIWKGKFNLEFWEMWKTVTCMQCSALLLTRTSSAKDLKDNDPQLNTASCVCVISTCAVSCINTRDGNFTCMSQSAHF